MSYNSILKIHITHTHPHQCIYICITLENGCRIQQLHLCSGVRLP